MKFQADKGKTERQFEVGDLVFLKLQPYIQSSLAPRANQKMAFKFFGPFKILQRIGQVAYKLDLPATSSVHQSSMFRSSSRQWGVSILSHPYYQKLCPVCRF
jgi:hypothetical protein